MSNNFREVLLKDLKTREEEERTPSVRDHTSLKYSIIDGRFTEPNLMINIDEENEESIDHLAILLSSIEQKDFIPKVLMYIEQGLTEQNRLEDFAKLVEAIEKNRKKIEIRDSVPVINPSELSDPTAQFECIPQENKKPRKVVWEKYENVVERQIEVSKRIRNTLFSNSEEDDIFAPYKDSSEMPVEDLEDDDSAPLLMPPSLISDIRIMTVFDSWICYTNFDITESIATKINSLHGVELFKVHTRYRFMVSISKAFDFKEFVKDFNQEFGISNE